MDKLLKFFPFLPESKDGGKLAIALIFYLLVPPIAAMILGAIFGVTVILLPLAFIVGLAGGAYSIAGVILSILSFTGYDFTGGNKADS